MGQNVRVLQPPAEEIGDEAEKDEHKSDHTCDL